MTRAQVLEIYRITLLSNLMTYQIIVDFSFRDLQNYTTLKRPSYPFKPVHRFRDLQNYTTLKPQIKFEAQE